jgi:hypothetical protein
MDESERQRRSPSWGARPPKQQPVSKRIVVPIWQESGDPSTWLLNLVLVVLLCVVVMALATAGLRSWASSRIEGATGNDGSAGLQGPLPSPERAAARSLAESTQEIEREARAKVQREADERLQAAVKQRTAEEEAARRTIALDARREREWQAFYKKPDFCDDAAPQNDSVGCANDFIRQRRTFDEQWAARNR